MLIQINLFVFPSKQHKQEKTLRLQMRPKAAKFPYFAAS